MDFFDNQYYRINKRLLSVYGLWPLQSRKEQYLFQTTTVLVVGSIVVPKIIKFAAYLGDMNGMIECLPVLGIHSRSIMKFINCNINAKQMKQLTTEIQETWAVRTADFETTILRHYAERGRLLSILYAVYLAGALVMYLALPLKPFILDIFAPLNETRQRIFLYETEYFVDQEANYFYITLHACISMPCSLGIIVAYDAMFAVYVHHVCGIFAMLGSRLENLGSDYDQNKSVSTDISRGSDSAYMEVVACIKMHKQAVELSTLIESSGTVCYLFVVGISMMVITLTGFMTVMNMDTPSEVLRLGMFAIGEIFYLFYLCWQGHVLMEHSERIFTNAYNVDWYDISPQAKKLLILIMMRSAEPCKLSAGKVFILSMENFTTAMKTSMSYFTVLLSFQ